MFVSQLDSRLYNRSTGLIESRSGVVDFIHQTVKEFVMSKRAMATLLQDVPQVLHTSGIDMIFRYFALITVRYCLEKPLSSNLQDTPAPFHGSREVRHSKFFRHAHIIVEGLEKGVVHRYLQPYLSPLDKQDHFNLITQLI
jgi:hypothetical protein